MTKAVFETDVLNDFSLRTGALFVNGQKPWSKNPYGAEARLPNIYTIHNHARNNGWLILGCSDRHFYEDAELIRNAGGVFDDHAMNGTIGQLRLADLEPQKDIYIRAKDGPFMGIRNYILDELKTYIEAAKKGMHLIFEKQSYDVGTNPNFRPTFEELVKQGLDEVYNDGFATDYCGKAAVLRQLEFGRKINRNLKIYVVTDAIEEVNIDFQGRVDMEFGKKALEEMVRAGAELITTEEVLKRL